MRHPKRRRLPSRERPAVRTAAAPNRKIPSFTWWGGAIGPRLLSHAKCLDCGAGYNWKTGRSNTTAIIIYQVVGVVLGLGLGWWLISSMH